MTTKILTSSSLLLLFWLIALVVLGELIFIVLTLNNDIVTIKNISKMTITEKLDAAEQAKKTPDKKKK